MAPPLVGDRIGGASVVPENLSVTLGERRDGAGQSARIGPEEQIDTILGQESQDILPRAFRSAPVVEGDQAERKARPRGTHGHPAGPLDMVRPEPESIQALLPLQSKSPAEGKRDPGDDHRVMCPLSAASASVFAAMMKSFRWSPRILWVHQVTVTRPHSVRRAGWWPSSSARAPTRLVKASASAKVGTWNVRSSWAIPSRSTSCQSGTWRLRSATSASVTRGESRRQATQRSADSVLIARLPGASFVPARTPDSGDDGAPLRPLYARRARTVTATGA